MKKKVIVIGWILKGKIADCGETMKNQLMIHKLEEKGIQCLQMDFKDWKKHPWVLFETVWTIIVHRSASLILATSAQNVYPLMRLMKAICWKQNTIHWVIGGSLGQKVQNGTFRPDVIGYMKHTLVESELMKEQLESKGVDGVKVVPNFKPINYYPQIIQKKRYNDGRIHFVFLSRIMPEKGCDYIIKAAELLNLQGYEKRYLIDFYGRIADGYKKDFLMMVKKIPNVYYNGFLNLRNNVGYDQLATYDVMLFPTYWKGEGLAGVFIDAFISGVPMIVTDWAHNRSFMNEGETALFVPVHNVIALLEKMKECIEGKHNLTEMSRICQQHAERFNVDNVITEELLKEIGIM